MIDLASEAEARGLPRIARALREADLPLPADADSELEKPAPDDPPFVLECMVRRGLQPELMERILIWLGDRPTELTVASWDFLCETLIGPDERALSSLCRQNVAQIDEILPAPGSAFVNTRTVSTVAMIERLSLPLYQKMDAAKLERCVIERHLGALEEIRRRGQIENPRRELVVEGTRQFARVLHLAHLPTLASFYLDYLFRSWEYRPALADLVEVLLEQGAVDSLPPAEDFIVNGTADELELLGYVDARSRLIKKDHRALYDQLKHAPNQIDYSRPAAEVASKLQRNHLVMAEAALEFGDVPVPFEVIDLVAKQDRSWRYAAQVRAAMVAKLSPPASPEPLATIDSFLGGFGNRFRMWYLMARYVPKRSAWLPGLHRRLVREAERLPHDFHVWAAMAAMLEPQAMDPLLAELEQRTASQCKKP
jgi:hypothetical protein